LSVTVNVFVTLFYHPWVGAIPNGIGKSFLKRIPGKSKPREKKNQKQFQFHQVYFWAEIRFFTLIFQPEFRFAIQKKYDRNKRKKPLL
jgi:hypothetical protein